MQTLCARLRQHKGLDRDLWLWVRKEVSVTIPGPRTFFGMRNAGAAVRGAQLSEVRTTLCEKGQEIVDGNYLERQGESSKVEVRPTGKEQMAELRKAVTRLGCMIRSHLRTVPTPGSENQDSPEPPPHPPSFKVETEVYQKCREGLPKRTPEEEANYRNFASRYENLAKGPPSERLSAFSAEGKWLGPPPTGKGRGARMRDSPPRRGQAPAQVVNPCAGAAWRSKGSESSNTERGGEGSLRRRQSAKVHLVGTASALPCTGTVERRCCTVVANV